MAQLSIVLKRAYEKPSPSDGTRVLVERLWPRGVSKRTAKIDLWLREVAPSTELRRWFRHDPEKWHEFKRRYFEELAGRQEPIEALLKCARSGRVTFVFGSREERFNNAAALREYLELKG